MEKMMTVKTGITNDGVVIAGLISVMFNIRPQAGDPQIGGLITRDYAHMSSCNIIINFLAKLVQLCKS